MDPVGEIVLGLLILTGLVGILVPMLPGLVLVAGSVVVWAFLVGTGVGWSVAVLTVVLATGGTVFKFLVPGRRLKRSGVPTSTMLVAGLLAIVGFFVIPVVGAPIGFVAGTYLAERRRLGPLTAGPSTRASLAAIAMSIGIELTAGLLIAGAWLLAVLFWT